MGQEEELSCMWMESLPLVPEGALGEVIALCSQLEVETRILLPLDMGRFADLLSSMPAHLELFYQLQ